jgi:sugar lactone lactonase YvrE
VAELKNNGVLVPYPDDRWNDWTWAKSPGDHFVCVQSVYAGPDGWLWVLDPANPEFQGVVEGGPKLVKINPSTDEIERVYPLPAKVAPQASYLNDVRVDPEAGFAYITDSGLGALVVLNLETGQSRRLLADHPSTKSEGITLEIGGQAWKRPDGSVPEVHADGIALDLQRGLVYYQALTGRTLYRVETAWLNDPEAEAWQLADEVEEVGEPGPADGIAWDRSTDRVLLTSLEQNAIRALDPETGDIDILARDPRIAWPDSIAVFTDVRMRDATGWAPAGEGRFGGGTYIYFTTSQIHRAPATRGPYRLFLVLAGPHVDGPLE